MYNIVNGTQNSELYHYIYKWVIINNNPKMHVRHLNIIVLSSAQRHHVSHRKLFPPPMTSNNDNRSSCSWKDTNCAQQRRFSQSKQTATALFLHSQAECILYTVHFIHSTQNMYYTDKGAHYSHALKLLAHRFCVDASQHSVTPRT